MCRVIGIDGINKEEWSDLVKSSPVVTWFQTMEAYDFFSSLSFLEPFAFGVEGENRLKGVAVGYIQRDGGKVKQYLSRRAIIIGGPLLAEDVTDEELTVLLRSLNESLRKKAIYIETRNFNDYGRWRRVFEECGFRYEPHLNFHVGTESVEEAQARIGKHRWRYIRLSLRDGAQLVEQPTKDQLDKFYSLLMELYRTKVKKPLFPMEFFEKLYALESARFFLIEYEGEIVGGSVCVCLEGKAVYEWMKCGDDHSRKNIRPSSVATWLGIKHAAENGCKVYDFMGAGKPNEPYGVRDFKAEFGGELVEHGRFIHECHPWLYYCGKKYYELLSLSRNKA